MERTSLARQPCPIARAADQLGDAWTLLVLRDVFLGAHRFAQLQERLGIAPNILTRRLALLTRRGLLEAHPYSRRPLRHAYTLTPKGAATLPVLLTLAAWGNAWLAPRGAPLVPIDPRTGRAVEPVLIDKRTGRPLVAGAVAVKAGPGAPRSLSASLRAPRVFTAGSRA
jgi:DNA-binding HxlR family transcriptional regulator